jgi:3-deoxy-7-phosphoheptulonate synthase
MLVVMQSDAGEEQIEHVCKSIRALGLVPHPIPGESRVAIGITGNRGPVDAEKIAALPGVTELIHVTKPYKLTGREMQADNTIVHVGNVAIGGKEMVVMAGPCSVETREQTLSTARAVRKAGATLLRGGAFKPRTSPYSFQGLGREGLEILSDARKETGLPIISEVVDTESFDIVEEFVDVIQIGSRNMQNYSLLRRAGKARKPVLLKRWMSGTLKEFLLAAEYIMSEGNRDVILCERGIRAFSDYSRFTLDITIVPELKGLTHLPIIVDPSHAGGKRHLVTPLARAGVAAGADGIIVEVHPDPDTALSDGPQALTFDMFGDMVEQLRAVAESVHRPLPYPA